MRWNLFNTSADRTYVIVIIVVITMLLLSLLLFLIIVPQFSAINAAKRFWSIFFSIDGIFLNWNFSCKLMTSKGALQQLSDMRTLFHMALNRRRFREGQTE